MNAVPHEQRKQYHELTERRIKDIFTARCYARKLYVPLRNLLREIEVMFSDRVPTLAIGKDGRTGAVRLRINRTFLQKRCENDSDIADCIMHELFHHLLRHLDEPGDAEASQQTRNLAFDSIINAHLMHIESAGFFVKYYPDKVPYAFLRSGSQEFLLPDAPAEPSMFQKVARASWKTAKKNKPPEKLLRAYTAFYKRVYDLQVTKDEAIDFFLKHFPEELQEPLPFVGSHGASKEGEDGEQAAEGAMPSGATSSAADSGSGSQGEPADDSQATDSDGDDSKAGEQGDARFGRERSIGSIFDPDEVQDILEALGLRRASRQVKNNFAQIIKRVTTLSSKPGKFRHGTVYRKQMPARLGRRDLLSVERGRYLFERGDFKDHEIAIFFDYSGSMGEYRKFLVDLARSLVREGKTVRVFVWADGIREAPVKDFLAGKIPNVGWGTNGNIVAKFLRKENIKQCVIVTDNDAGDITTKITGKVFLVLVKHGQPYGSFADRAMVPNREIFRLEPGGTYDQ